MKPRRECDLLCTRCEQAECDCLGVSVCKPFVICLWEKEFSPVLCQVSQCLTAQIQLFCDFIAQKMAQLSSRVRKLLGAVRRHWLPTQEALKHRLQSGRRLELAPRGFDVAIEGEHRSHERTVLPEAKRVAICVHQ